MYALLSPVAQTISLLSKRHHCFFLNIIVNALPVEKYIVVYLATMHTYMLWKVANTIFWEVYKLFFAVLLLLAQLLLNDDTLTFLLLFFFFSRCSERRCIQGFLHFFFHSQLWIQIEMAFGIQLPYFEVNHEMLQGDVEQEEICSSVVGRSGTCSDAANNADNAFWPTSLFSSIGHNHDCPNCG